MPGARSTARRWITGATALVVAVVAAVALSGGFGEVPRERLPVLPPGATFDNGVYRITVKSWSVRDTDPVLGYDLRRPVVVADAVVRLTGDAPSRRASDWLRPLDLGIGAGVGTIRSARDGSFGPPVQPGLPVHLLYTWEVPAASGVGPGDGIRLGVYERYAAEDLPIEGVTTPPVLVAVYGGTSR